MDPEVRQYIDGMAPEHRPLFDRVNRLIVEACPEVRLVLSYRMPTYQVGKRALHVGVWRHGISIYGWGKDRDAGFSSRHPTLVSGKATIQLRSRDAAEIADDELRDLARAALKA